MNANRSDSGASSTLHANTRVGKDEWTRAALEVIAAEGVAGVKVEGLARRLGITKGSFYWHFRDRMDLIEAALELWYRIATVEVIERLDQIEDPKRRLRALFVESFGDLVDGSIDALVLAQVDDPIIGPTVALCTTERLEFLTRTYCALGLPPQQAAARARLLYATYIGSTYLQRVPGGAAVTRREEAAFEQELESLLSV